MATVQFDRATLLAAFHDLGRSAWAEGATVEIAIYGGSALMPIFDWRAATKDVDGVLKVQFGLEEIFSPNGELK